tara:strand:+ start:105 stop:386 length:282 start_codon:yes stop_codon:yes gene_type:complete
MQIEMENAPKVKKTKVDYNRTYYMKHKTENHKRQMLSCIRTRGRVPHLYTVLQRNLNITEVSDAWADYKVKMQGKEIAPNKILEMRVLIGNMI